MAILLLLGDRQLFLLSQSLLKKVHLFSFIVPFQSLVEDSKVVVDLGQDDFNIWETLERLTRVL